MQLQLKQAEIKSALMMYVAAQGIVLAGKTVDIAFTSGRKDNGLSADITIEDTRVNGGEDPVEHTKPGLTVVAAAPPAVTETVPELEGKKDTPDVAADQPAPAGGKPSLFG